MAEARSAVHVIDQQKRGIRLVEVTDEGLRFQISVLIPHPSVILIELSHKIHRFRNAVVNGLWPLTPAIFFIITLIVISIVVSADSSSWWRSGWLAEILWIADSYIPGTIHLPTNLRVGYLAAIASLFGLFLILTIQRYILRLLFTYKGWLFSNPGDQQSIQTTIWAIFVKILSGKNNLTYGFQSVLPKLPVPSLNATIPKYLKTVKPLLSEEEYEQTVQKAKDFLKNEGNKLQRYLILKSWIADNYMVDWWEKYVYLRGRDPIMINSNYYILDTLRKDNYLQVSRAADLIYQFLRFRVLLDREEIPPQMIRDLVPLCMAQHKRIFNTTRIPGRECDSIQHLETSFHIAVYCKGYWYEMKIWHHKMGTHYLASEIEDQLKWIKDDATKTREKNLIKTDFDRAEASIGALTSDNRTHWAVTREEYFSDGVNKYSLDMIERAAFVVILDDFSSDDWSERGRSLFHGDGTNRWFDKSFTLVVFADGRSGLSCEHAWADAPVAAFLFEWSMFKYLLDGPGFDAKGMIKRNPEEEKNRTPLKPPQRLRWELNDGAVEAILKSVQNAKQMINNISLEIACQDSYGKGFMKKCRISPDAYVQMVLQLAYYRDAGKFALTYEASMTRLFLKGRTETVRSLSEDSAAFVNAMESKDPSITKKDKINLLKKATDAHQDYYRNAMCGKGVDRHLFALYVVSQGLQVESPFLKEALRIPWSLSTSQQPQQQTDVWTRAKKAGIELQFSPGGGFGPVANDGYGVSYMITDDTHIYFHVSSNISSPKTDSKRFIKNILKAFDDVKALWD